MLFAGAQKPTLQNSITATIGASLQTLFHQYSFAIQNFPTQYSNLLTKVLKI